VGFVVDEVALEQGFLQVLRISSVSIIPPVFHTHLHLPCCSYQKDKGAKPGEPSKGIAPSEVWVQWMGKHFHFFVFKGLELLELHF
jgi:hypothetical protein